MQAHAAARTGKALHRRQRASEMFVPRRDTTALGACIPPQMRDRGTLPSRTQGRAFQLILKGPARHLSWTPSPTRAYQLAPEGFCLCEDAVGTFCVPEHRRGARLLTTKKAAGGERFLGAASASLIRGVLHIDDSLRQCLVDGNVSQVAERILQFLQCRNEFLTPSYCFLVGESVGEELPRLTKFFRASGERITALM